MELITRQFGPNPKGSKLNFEEMDENLLAEVPTSTEEAWIEYTEKIKQIKDGLLETVNPLSIIWPKKP
jgi:hypothetical protein